MRLICGSGFALSASSEQILSGNKRYQRNCTSSTHSLFRANFLFLSCNQITYSHSFYDVFFLFTYFVPFMSVFFSSFYVHKHTHASCMFCNVYLATSCALLVALIQCVEFLFYEMHPIVWSTLCMKIKCVRRRLLILWLLVQCTLWCE